MKKCPYAKMANRIARVNGNTDCDEEKCGKYNGCNPPTYTEAGLRGTCPDCGKENCICQ